ncbi:cytochrome o ubiquinol oxidase subunit IV [Buchnera aphidicola]|uniref:cytochrome o ubiquinol oxidase subunit IV n=1 Tax=Buchnera aphidicola TaxID=9 RepID=UPI0030EE467E
MIKNFLKKIFIFFNCEYTSYNIAFFLSLILTFIPFFLVMINVFNKKFLFFFIFLFCILQIFVHIIFFLHIKNFDNTHWNLTFLIFTFLIIFIIVSGSIWIMWNLNHHEKFT